MLADDGPAPLSAGRQNPYQQPSGGAANGSGGPGSQLQRKRPREDGDFLDNRPLGFPLGATGGPTTKGQLESINNNSGDNQQQSGGQQPQQAQPLQSSTTKSVGDQLGTQIVGATLIQMFIYIIIIISSFSFINFIFFYFL